MKTVELALVLRARTEEAEAGVKRTQRAVRELAEEVERAGEAEERRRQREADATDRSVRLQADRWRQLGYQISDVVSQVSAGTSVLRALAQQGAQAAQAFGPIGAVVGAVAAAVLGLASAVGDARAETVSAAAAVERLDAALGRAESALAAQRDLARDVAHAYRDLYEASREVARLQIEVAISRLQESLAALPSAAAEAVQKLRELDPVRRAEEQQRREGLRRELVERPWFRGLRAAPEVPGEAERARLAEAEWVSRRIQSAIERIQRGELLAPIVRELHALASGLTDPELARGMREVVDQLTDLAARADRGQRALEALRQRLHGLETDRPEPEPEARQRLEFEIRRLELRRQQLEAQLRGAAPRDAAAAVAARARELELERLGVSREAPIAQRYLEVAAAVDELARALERRAEAEREAARARELAERRLDEERREAERRALEEERRAARLAEEARRRQIEHAELTFRVLEQQWRASLERPTLQVGMLRALKNVADEASNVGAQIREAVGGAFASLEDALVTFARTGKLEFSALIDSILTDITRLMTRRFVTGPLAEVLGSALADAFGGAPVAAAAQGAVVDAGRIVPFQAGGIVERPTLFPLRGGRIGLMGEAGPEAILPLKRLPSGRLGVEAAPPAQPWSPRIEVRVIDQRGAPGPPIGVRIAEQTAERTAIEVAIADVLSQLVQSGRLDRPLGSRYGLRPLARW